MSDEEPQMLTELNEHQRYRLMAEGRKKADPHIKAALDALHEAIDAFGGWWPKDPECAFAVGHLIAVASLIEGLTDTAHIRMWRQANDRLYEAILRSDEQKQKESIQAIRDGKL